MIRLKLHRKRESDLQTIGVMEVWKDNLFIVSFATLEQEWNNNEISNSCISLGDYPVKHYSSPKYPDAFILEETNPRTSILIHNGNYNTHTKGCILIGYIHSDINADNYLDVIYSKNALNKLNEICKYESSILISIV